MDTIDTIIKSITGKKEDEEVFAQAAGIIRRGGLVAFPTETVYGLGADAGNEAACRHIYEAKKRPSDNPLIIHIAKKNDLKDFASDITDTAKKLTEAFWPGPLTVILKKKEGVNNTVTGGLDTVAIRCPRHKTARALIKASGCAIAAPSANLSGRPSPVRAEYVISDLTGRVDMIICDDSVDIGIESVIVDCSADVPVILRPGIITPEQIKEVAGGVIYDVAEHVSSSQAPRAPGMKYRHYAPEAELAVVRGNQDLVRNFINKSCLENELKGKKCAVLAPKENLFGYKAQILIDLGSGEDEKEAAARLFNALRECDKEKADMVYVQGMRSEGVGLALMNRLIKASGHNIIDV